MKPVTSYNAHGAAGAPGRVSRRRLIRGAVVTVGGLAGAAMVGCSSAPPETPASTAAAPAAGTSAPAPAAKQYPAGSLVPVVTGSPVKGGTFTEGVTGGVASEFDSHTALTSMQWRNSGELAILPEQWTGALTANVVESWESPDASTFILKVRDGVALHDLPPWNGRNFNAEDLAFNVNRISGNTAEEEGVPRRGFQRASTMAGLKSAEAVDESHAKITLDSPSGQFLSGFTDHRNFMMPKGVVEVGFKDPIALAGTAQYQLTELNPSREVYERFDKGWRGAPYFDKYVRLSIPDRAAFTAAFISKQTSVLGSPTDQDKQNVEGARPDALYYETPGYLMTNIRPNHKHGAFGDFRVRKAISLSLDYQEIAESNFGKSATYLATIGSSYPEAWSSEKVLTLPGYNPATKEKDIAEGVKMMAAAGHENGAGIQYEILVSYGSVAFRENALRMQAQLGKIFPEIDITVKPASDRASFSKLQSGRNFEAVAYTVGPGSAVTTEAITHFHTKGSRNYESFENAENDALLEKAREALGLDERKQLMETWQQKFMDEWMPIWFLHTPPVSAFLQPNIGGYDTVVGPWSQWWPYYREGDLHLVG